MLQKQQIEDNGTIEVTIMAIRESLNKTISAIAAIASLVNRVEDYAMPKMYVYRNKVSTILSSFGLSETEKF